MRALIAAALVLTAVPIVAASGQEDVTVQAPKQVCRRMEVPASGSRISRRRVCMTAAQWRERSGVSTDDAEDELDVLNREDPGHVAPNRLKAKGAGPF